MSKFLIVFAVLARLVPHPGNFTPVGAFGLFAGAHMSLKTAWTVPVAALLVSNLFVGTYNLIAMAGVYIGFLVGPLLGRFMLRGRIKPGRVATAVILNAGLFFLISNFGVWAAGYYPPTFAGLIACYVAGLPFLGYSLLGDSFYSILLFAGYAAIEQRIPLSLRFA